MKLQGPLLAFWLLAFFVPPPPPVYAWPDKDHHVRPTAKSITLDVSDGDQMLIITVFDKLTEMGFRMPKNGETFSFKDYFIEVPIGERKLLAGDLVFVEYKGSVLEGILYGDYSGERFLAVGFPINSGWMIIPVKGEDVKGILRAKYKTGQIET